MYTSYKNALNSRTLTKKTRAKEKTVKLQIPDQHRADGHSSEETKAEQPNEQVTVVTQAATDPATIGHPTQYKVWLCYF